MPCIVCEYPVPVKAAKPKLFIDKALVGAGVETRNVIAICGSRRCKRLLSEALRDNGKTEVGFG